MTDTPSRGVANRPQPRSIGDELLDVLIDRAEQTNALLGQILDRLPTPPAEVGGEPARIEIREPVAPAQPAAAPRRRGRPPKIRET